MTDVAPMPAVQCTAASDRPNWPTYHFFNKVRLSPTGPLMEPLNDANAIFEYKGLFHVMMQAGGGNWTHGISNDLVHWFELPDALSREHISKVPWDSHQGPCDGTLSFPDLLRPPFDGTAPVILYGPDCNQPVDDAPRVEVALPKDPADATLREWVKQMPGPAQFDGTPCSFPGRVWRSTRGRYWNMVCARGGASPWTRYSTNSSDLMRGWHESGAAFTFSAETGHPQPIRTCYSGAYFHAIPNPKAGGPTHMINTNRAGPLLLGSFDAAAERFYVNNSFPPQVLDASAEPQHVLPIGGTFKWAAVGGASDGRLLLVAWVTQAGNECDHGWRGGFGGCARHTASLIRELSFDHAADRLVSRPVSEYAALRNATFVSRRRVELPPGSLKTLRDVPASAGGALDVLVSFDVGKTLAGPAAGFGVSVRAPHDSANSSITVLFNVSAPHQATARGGARTVTVSFAPPVACIAGRGSTGRGECGAAAGVITSNLTVLQGESLDVRLLVDRPIVEIFVQGGRAAFTHAAADFDTRSTAVHLLGGDRLVTASSVSVYGLGCGWTGQMPLPRSAPRGRADARG